MGRRTACGQAFWRGRECSTLHELSVSYGKHLAIVDVSLSVGRGEIVVMLGANGAGKSSCLKALGGVVPHLPGARITLGDVDLAALPQHELVEAGLALVPEDRGIFADLSVRENLQLGAFTRRARARAADNLERIVTLFPRLAERMDQLASTMSGGERQMVAIGRALMSSPDILLLDEPSLGLAPLVCSELFQALARIKELGVGVLLVEQNARAALAIADRGYLLENGRIVGEGSAAAAARRSGRAPRLSGRQRAGGERRTKPPAAGRPRGEQRPREVARPRSRCASSSETAASPRRLPLPACGERVGVRGSESHQRRECAAAPHRRLRSGQLQPSPRALGARGGAGDARGEGIGGRRRALTSQSSLSRERNA